MTIQRTGSSSIYRRQCWKLVGIVSFAWTVLSAWAAAPDLSSAFVADAEGWRADNAGVSVAWQGTGGTPDGFLRGAGPAGTNAWYFVSPTAWAGDWSGYKVLKFDFAIPSRHYPDAERAGMVVMVGANGQRMTWTASTPLWTWTHYEVALSPSAFDVSQAVFDGIMTNAAQLQILAEFSAATETVGLDNVLVTAASAQAHQTNLVSRFTDGTIQGWRPVDDVTLSAEESGQPSFDLKADDWMDGRLYKVATPVTWAGDWRQYRQLSFDMYWTGDSATHTNVELVRIFGANGQTLSWLATLSPGVWTHRRIPFTPETFGVDAAQLEAVLSHVGEMWIFGEFTGGDDITHLDNIILSVDSGAPPRITQNLVTRFDEGAEGWRGFDNSTVTWLPSGGVSGGALQSIDAGGGTARFQSPDAWSGDWRSFQTLRFMLYPQVSTRANYNATVWFVTWNGDSLSVDLPIPYGSWTPYTLDLTPAAFGVDSNRFDTIMADVACLWINADLVNGSGAVDTTLLDNVMLLTESGPGLPPDRRSDFEGGNQNWRYGAWRTGAEDWGFSDLATYAATDGNPGGHIENTDTGDWTYWFTPEAWAGDWRGLQSVSFDFKIISGTSLFETRMISLCSVWTNLHANVATSPVPGQWDHYEFTLTPATFGVSEAVFEQVMRDVVMLGVRSEWINGGEREGLDNFRLTKASDAFWSWMAGYFSGPDLTNEQVAGKYADPDGDSADNWGEFIAGTHPANRLEYPRIERFSITNATAFLEFNTHTGRVYAVETAANLPATNLWTPLTNNMPGTGSSVTVPAGLSGTPRYYRLKINRVQ